MEDSRVDVILEYLRKNNFARAEAALRSEIDNRPDLNGFMQGVSLEEKESGVKLLEKVNSAKLGGVSNQVRNEEVSKEKHIVKDGRNGPDSKFEIGSFDGEKNSEPVGSVNNNFMFSNGSDDNRLDLYTWRYNPSNGSINPCDDDDDEDDGILTDNVKEYQISSQSKIHPSEASDTQRINRKVGEETDAREDTKVSLLGPVSSSKANLVPNIVDNPWSRNDEFKRSSSELWKDCSVKTVFPFPEGDASTSYKQDGKQKNRQYQGSN